ncbi:MAG: hypothetical protein DBX66_06350 [Clostridiales bacterium]|nr:MAG: hypothetical protein DBX66_06350 [Clostridiales bacterium]RGB66471.1 diguanylate cyclase [Harryflintia acetispora]
MRFWGDISSYSKVGDQMENREVILFAPQEAQRFLTRFGRDFELAGENDAPALLRRASAVSPRLSLILLALPGEESLAALEALGREEALRRVPVVVFLPDGALEERALRLGAYEVLLGCQSAAATELRLARALAHSPCEAKARALQEQVRLGEERYRLIMEKSDGVIFEWDIGRDRVHFSEVWEQRFGHPAQMEHFLGGFDAQSFLEPQDAPIFRALLERVRAGAPYSEATVRVRKGEGSLWMRVGLTGLREESLHSAVGILIDVDREMREAQRQRRRAERDGLTGLYNKTTAEAMIRDYLDGEGKGRLHALMVLDFDNFKAVNDSYGHRYGDRLLVEVTRRISGFFRASDIIGRAGGDEFIILMKDLPGRVPVEERARELCGAFLQTSPGGQVSGSVGIALSTPQGGGYEALYEQADLALYEAKRQGKGTFCFYSGGLRREGAPSPKSDRR